MQRNFKAELILLFVTLLWGATFIATKEGLHSAPPLLLLSLRFAAAALPLLPFCWRALFRIDREILKRGIVLGILMFGGYGFQNMSLQYTTAGRSALITYFFALLVPFLQIPFTGKPVSRGNIAGLTIVVGGLILLNLPATVTGELNPGDMLALGSAVSYAFFIIFLDRYTRSGDLFLLTFIQFAVTAVLSLLVSLPFENTFLILDGHLAWSLVYLSFFGSFVCLLLMNRFQREVTPVKAVIIYAMEPVFAVLLGMVLLGEKFSPAEWIGAILIIAGVILSDIWNLAGNGRDRTPEIHAAHTEK